MSFSGRGYHDFHENQHRINGRRTTIEEQNAAIQSTLHQHPQWQANMGHAIADIQQQRQQQNQN
jgi:hypothetical protein